VNRLEKSGYNFKDNHELYRAKEKGTTDRELHTLTGEKSKRGSK
jgi:hypothetical protein